MQAQPLSFSAVKLRTSPVFIRALRDGIILFALAFMAAMGSVETATFLATAFPSAALILFTLPTAVFASSFVAWFVLYDYESPAFLDIGILHLTAIAAFSLILAFCFSWLAHGSVGTSMAPGWAHADRIMGLENAREQIKEGGGALSAPQNKMIALALKTHGYEDVRQAYRQYDDNRFRGEAFARWMMAHHLYPIYDKDRLAQLQAAGWVDKKVTERVKADAIKMSPPPGSTLIQQQAWAVLAGEANPMDRMGKVLEGKR